MRETISLMEEADFALDSLTISPQTCSVLRDSLITRVEPKVMEVLVVLARAKGESVTREHLIDLCWEGRIVSDDAVTRILSKARKIGALTNPPAFQIETRPKVGVRLVAQGVHQPCQATTQSTPRQKEELLLVVFPFENLSTDPDMNFFSDGVSEEVLSRLMLGSKLKVIGPASSFQYRGAGKADAALALKATHIVDGSVRRAGDKVRINAHVTDVATGEGIWAQTFQGDLGDIFALQDEIADGIAQALFAKFTPANRVPINPAIYDLYLRAKDIETITERQLVSIASLERVTQTAPGFADGWGRLATLRALQRLNVPYLQRDDITQKTKSDIARCHALDPYNREANYANYWLAAPYGDFMEQEHIVAKALAAENPASDDYAMGSFHNCNVGRWAHAYALASKAHSFDPSSWAVQINYGMALWSMGETAASLRALKTLVDLWPQDQQGTAYLLILLVSLNDWAEIDRLTDPKRLAQFSLREHSGFLATLPVLRSPTPDNKAFLLAMMTERAFRLGSIDCSTFLLMGLLDRIEEAYTTFYQFPVGPVGAKGEALGMIGYRTVLLFMPGFAKGRADPRFARLCARLGLVDYWMETGHWPDCADEVPYDFRAACRAAQDTPRDVFLG